MCLRLKLLGYSLLESAFEQEELELQSTILKAQIDAQNEKILDLESEIQVKKKSLQSADVMLENVSHIIRSKNAASLSTNLCVKDARRILLKLCMLWWGIHYINLIRCKNVALSTNLCVLKMHDKCDCLCFLFQNTVEVHVTLVCSSCLRLLHYCCQLICIYLRSIIMWEVSMFVKRFKECFFIVVSLVDCVKVHVMLKVLLFFIEFPRMLIFLLVFSLFLTLCMMVVTYWSKSFVNCFIMYPYMTASSLHEDIVRHIAALMTYHYKF